MSFFAFSPQDLDLAEFNHQTSDHKIDVHLPVRYSSKGYIFFYTLYLYQRYLGEIHINSFSLIDFGKEIIVQFDTLALISGKLTTTETQIIAGQPL